MKRIWAFALLLFMELEVTAQKELPSVQVQVLNAGNINTRSLIADSIPVILSFWSVTCRPCIWELNALAEQLPLWQKEVHYKVVAVSTDDVRSVSKVKAIVSASQWPFMVLLDKNQDFKRAFNVSVIPQLYIIDPSGKVVFTRIGYSPGSEAEVLEVLKNLK
ncbi:TlpA family protein disulfide reductase [Niabella aquatica]